MILALIVTFILQFIRLCNSGIEDKCKFFIKTQLNFIPNYIMLAIGIFLQTMAFMIDEVSGVSIFVLCL